MQNASKIIQPFSDNTNENATMVAFREGDKDAFREIYDCLVRPLTYFVENIVFSQIDAEDIVANAFSKLFKARSDMRSIEHVKRWLYVIARNEAIDYLRLRRKRRETHSEITYLDSEWSDHFETEHVKAAVLQGLLQEIEKLPRQRKTILRLYFFEQKSTAEIAIQLGLNAQTVLNHKAKALESLRKSQVTLRWRREGIVTLLIAISLYLFS